MHIGDGGRKGLERFSDRAVLGHTARAPLNAFRHQGDDRDLTGATRSTDVRFVAQHYF
jgi:hypothetical protein